ncbi:hypothetical protein DQ04_02991090 [Trypanosoma grayi]|uniref:hypothetical protein n=1 Tax=Trypanosoma grayi TaxID=71804 RepID=UPI0004F4377B|nr:hypothetical protein DQ04_02991090 [Trypanosoma grayi]KEG11093.1 hypothetical protein DQ04_02991090 [Trypanosoma grayi]
MAGGFSPPCEVDVDVQLPGSERCLRINGIPITSTVEEALTRVWSLLRLLKHCSSACSDTSRSSSSSSSSRIGDSNVWTVSRLQCEAAAREEQVRLAARGVYHNDAPVRRHPSEFMMLTLQGVLQKYPNTFGTRKGAGVFIMVVYEKDGMMPPFLINSCAERRQKQQLQEDPLAATPPKANAAVITHAREEAQEGDDENDSTPRLLGVVEEEEMTDDDGDNNARFVGAYILCGA